LSPDGLVHSSWLMGHSLCFFIYIMYIRSVAGSVWHTSILIFSDRPRFTADSHPHQDSHTTPGPFDLIWASAAPEEIPQKETGLFYFR
jgi:hypothetical protein